MKVNNGKILIPFYGTNLLWKMALKQYIKQLLDMHLALLLALRDHVNPIYTDFLWVKVGYVLEIG